MWATEQSFLLRWKPENLQRGSNIFFWNLDLNSTNGVRDEPIERNGKLISNYSGDSGALKSGERDVGFSRRGECSHTSHSFG